MLKVFIGIQFGSNYTRCGISVFGGNVSSLTWKSNGHQVHNQTSTCILFDDRQYFDSYGFEAEEKYQKLVKEGIHHDWHFVSKFRNKLFQTDIPAELTSSNGKTIKSVKVVAASLSYIKDLVYDTLQSGIHDSKLDQFHWILTIPTTCYDRVGAELFMKNAGIKAGIDENNISVILESAAVFVDATRFNRFSGEELCKIEQKERFVIFHCGGERVELSFYDKTGNDTIREILTSNSDVGGENRVFQAFKNLFVKIFGSPVLKACAEGDPDGYNNILIDIGTKIRLVQEFSKGMIRIPIPESLLIKFKKMFEESNISNAFSNSVFSDKIHFARGELLIEKDLMLSFIEETNRDIVDYMRTATSKSCVKGTKMMIMTGGFSRSRLLQRDIIRTFPDMQVIVIKEPWLSVVRGATLFGYYPISVTRTLSLEERERQLQEREEQLERRIHEFEAMKTDFEAKKTVAENEILNAEETSSSQESIQREKEKVENMKAVDKTAKRKKRKLCIVL